MTVALFATAVVVSVVVWLLRPAVQMRRAELAARLVCLGTMTAPELPATVGGHYGAQLVLLAGAAVLLAPHVRGLLRRSIPIWLVAFLSVAFVSAAWSNSPAESLAVTGRLAVVSVLALSCAVVLGPSAVRRVFVEFAALVAFWFAVGALLLPARTFVPTRAPLYMYSAKVPLSGIHEYELGLAGLVLLVAAMHVGAHRQSAALVSTGLAMVLLPQKRATIVALIVLGLVWAWSKRPRLLVTAAAALVAAAIVFTTVPTLRQLWDREQAAPEADNALSYRTEIFDAAMERFRERPVIGGGLGVGDRGLTIPIGKPGFEFATHGELDTALAATGVLGTLAIVVGYLDLVVRGRRRWMTQSDWIPMGVALAMLSAAPFLAMVARPIHSLPYLLIVAPVGARSASTPGASDEAVRRE